MAGIDCSSWDPVPRVAGRGGALLPRPAMSCWVAGVVTLACVLRLSSVLMGCFGFGGLVLWAAGNRDLGALMDNGAVLAGEGRGHGECLSAEVVLGLGGQVRCERRELALWEGEVEAGDGHVRHLLERAARDAGLGDEGVA